MLPQHIVDFYKSQGGYKAYREKITRTAPKNEYERLQRYRRIAALKNPDRNIMDIFRKDR